MSIENKKLLIICGPTGVGKTSLAVKLAKKFGGEIISADSRQAYRKFNIATGKDLSELKGVQLHLVDVADPDQIFTVAHYCRLANAAIAQVYQKNKLPVIVGGTGFYIKAIVDGIDTLEIPPNKDLREQYQHKSAEELLMILARVDPELANSLNKSEQYNKQRLVRRIEIAQTGNTTNTQHSSRNYDTLFVGLTAPNFVLRKRIGTRIENWIRKGAEEEVKSLLDQGVSWESQAMSALGYKQWEPFFENKKSREEVVIQWKTEEFQYAKRQLTWFKKDKRVNWYDTSVPSWLKKVEKDVDNWYHCG
ncbi:MAG: tRNA (adenosine(37)-N6)-dimethylallyltransferase MiaA [Candidatus Blackburnbacteria bacterium]|nr:tRNA (adenosine(37)-N6)-dimethylallyltransferase MiaA [Candidatus Blackburnbacteria bacterium]